MAYLMSVLTEWDKEGDTGAILVFYIFTLIYYCLWGDSICCKHKVKWGKKNAKVCFLDYHLICVSSCLLSESQADL